MPQFSWLTFTQARAALAARLGVSQTSNANLAFWVDAELGLYIIEALRTWNALTNIWNTSYSMPVVANQVWYDLKTQGPRSRTVHDTDLYTIMAYHLIEQPASIGSTGQFQLSDFSSALQRRCDEVIQFSNCNIAKKTILTTGGRTGTFDDTVLAPIRARFINATGFGFNFGNSFGFGTFGGSTTLWRDDDQAFEYFTKNFLQATQTPTAYGVITLPPLGFAVDYAPLTGEYEFLVSVATSPAFNPPTSSLIQIPDDFSWVPKWGAMSDLLGMEPEATDTLRADYCLQRYRDGITLLQNSAWLLMSVVDGSPTDIVSAIEMDAYSPEWDSNASAPQAIVEAGIDYLAISPVPANTNHTVQLTLIQNAPIPVLDGDFVQVSRDSFDVILDYAQHLASFKMGGSEFIETKGLAKNFFLAATAANSRLKQLGLFRDILLEQGQRQEETDPRFEQEQEA